MTTPQRVKTLSVCVASGLLLSACSGGFLGSAPATQLFKRDGIDIISESASRRETFFKDRNTTERFCRAPGPDFAVTASEGVSIAVPGGQSVGEDAGKGALGLGGRNPEVLLAREMLFRACELSLNINADPKTTRDIYERFLQSIEKIATSQTGTGSSGVAATAPDSKTKSSSDSNSSDSSSSDSDGFN